MKHLSLATATLFILAAATLLLAEPAAPQNTEMSADEILKTANERIEKHRKGDASLELTLPGGKHLESGTLVQIQQTRHAFLFGCNAFKLNKLRKPEENEAYAKRFSDLLNFATLPFYWWNYERAEGHRDDARSEEIIRWCKKNNITPKGHPLAWNWGDPRWLPDDTDKVAALQFARIERCVERFKGDIDIWDVVNEATHYDRPSALKQAPKLTQLIQTMGRGPYLRKAFETARQASPDATLLINDYRTDPAYEKDVLTELVGKNKKPLYDVIGIQSHMHDKYWGVEKTWEVCERFAKYGKPLHFTETTLVSGALKNKNTPNPWVSTPEGEERQAKEVAEFYTVLFSHPSVEAITWWDFTDQSAWQGAPAGLLRADLSPKPAYKALMRLIKSKWWTRTNSHIRQDGKLKFRGFYGQYTATVRLGDRTYQAAFTLDRDSTSPTRLRLQKIKDPHASVRHIYENELARTPPMGWNSWNHYQKKINEDLLKKVADAMVESGMRDAGYDYLVLDDAWMAPERDKQGRLWGDPERFPNGMKALGDYIHAKGLKYGIYEDRGHSTCQQLPGSLDHEEIDMRTFAEWGVDYIKLDSCFAELNGRLTTDDYRIYKDAIIKAGRPIVLSISDFGNGGWAWDGKDIAHLWRTSGDIREHMSSVYNCAETSAGDSRTHPAFNGLWQFAGPGHWNDPDMLQVGNLPNPIEDRAHFSLWCILAAPLMAGNDIVNMTDTVRDILTAPEVIAVNQDPRAIQGYKVYVEGPLEIYNKPLHDGTTAVLLLNKGPKTSEITVAWEQIGLSGKQKVRDLWARKDLGAFQDRFTASALPQHGLMLIKVGQPGSKLVPVAAPVPPEKYMVTRSGVTHLSDLYYIWKKGSAPPKSDTNIEGGKITIDGTLYPKGLGFKAGNSAIYKVNRRAQRFQATVGLDDSYEGEEGGRFQVLNEDWFGRRILFDSGKMQKGDPPQTIDINIEEVNCLYLGFESSEGRKGKKDALGNWANARVSSKALAE